MKKKRGRNAEGYKTLLEVSPSMMKRVTSSPILPKALDEYTESEISQIEEDADFDICSIVANFMNDLVDRLLDAPVKKKAIALEYVCQVLIENTIVRRVMLEDINWSIDSLMGELVSSLNRGTKKRTEALLAAKTICFLLASLRPSLLETAVSGSVFEQLLSTIVASLPRAGDKGIEDGELGWHCLQILGLLRSMELVDSQLSVEIENYANYTNTGKLGWHQYLFMQTDRLLLRKEQQAKAGTVVWTRHELFLLDGVCRAAALCIATEETSALSNRKSDHPFGFVWPLIFRLAQLWQRGGVEDFGAAYASFDLIGIPTLITLIYSYWFTGGNRVKPTQDKTLIECLDTLAGKATSSRLATTKNAEVLNRFREARNMVDDGSTSKALTIVIERSDIADLLECKFPNAALDTLIGETLVVAQFRHMVVLQACQNFAKYNAILAFALRLQDLGDYSRVALGTNLAMMEPQSRREYVAGSRLAQRTQRETQRGRDRSLKTFRQTFTEDS